MNVMHCLVAHIQFSSCSVFEAELADHIPVIKTSIAGTRLVGRMCVGKVGLPCRHLLLPEYVMFQPGLSVNLQCYLTCLQETRTVCCYQTPLQIKVSPAVLFCGFTAQYLC